MTRALRIGVLLGGNLVEEKSFGMTAPITFGQSLRCAITAPVDGVPPEHVLFAFDRGRAILRLTPAMTGRMAVSGSKTEVITGDVAVPVGARGKITLGDV